MKKKVAVVFGGRSGEHEVSLVSASSIVKAMSRDKYEIFEIGITHEGKWLVSDEKSALEAFKSGQHDELFEAFISTDPNRPGVVFGDGKFQQIDVFFPVLHGPFGEDGTIQGLFEMINIPYVGCGVLASSTAMDKLQCKAIWESASLPVVPYVGINRTAWEFKKEEIIENVMEKIGVPCFVKPANMGSSVGISKAKTKEQLVEAIDLAAGFDRRILIEEALEVREIECAVLGNDDPVAAPIGEVIVGGEFYDYNDKYVNGVSATQVPADLPGDVMEKIKGICLKAYKILDCQALSRVDCFIDQKTGNVYLNEINTMPGFTSISMYPKMMEAHGIHYQELIDELIRFAFERFEEKNRNKISFDSGSDWYQNA